MGVDKGDEQQNEKEVNEEENGEDDINEEEEEEEEEEENVDQDVKRMERYEEPVASDKNIDLEELEMLCSNLGVPYHKVTFHLLTKSCGEDTKVWIKTRKLLIDRGVIIIPLHRVNDKGTIWESKPVVLPIVKQLRYTYCVQSTKLFGKINVKEEDFTRPIRDSKHIFEGTVSIKDYSFKKDIFIFWLSHFIKQINSSESFRKQLKLLEALQNCNKRYEPPWRTDCIYYLSKELQNNGNSMNVFQKLFLSLTIGLFPPFRGREMKKVEISHKILLDLEEFLIDLAESQPDAAKRISQHITDWALDVFQSKFVPFLCSNLSPHSSQWIKLLKHPLICPSQLIQAADFYAKVSIREILNEIVKLQDFIKHSSRSYYFKLISSLIPKMTSIDLLIELLSLDCENVLHLHEISNFADAQAAGEPIHQKGDFLSGLMVSNIVNNDFIKQYKDKNLPKSLSDPSSMWCFNHQIVRLLNNYKSLDQLIDLFNSFPLNLKSISMQHFQNAILNLIKKENNIEEKYIKQLIKHKELFYPVEQHQQQQANPIGEESLIEKLSSTIIGNTKYCYLFPSILKYRISQCNEYHQEILTVDWFKTYNQSSSEMGGYKSVSLIYPYIKSNEKLIDTLLKSSEQHAIQFSEIDILKNANYINQFSSIPEIQRSYYELIERILPSYATTSLHAVHSLGYILSPSSSSSSDNKEGGDNELSNYTIPSKFIESLIIQLISLPSVECSKIHEVFDKNNFWLKVLKLSGEINSLKINHKYKLVKSIYNDFIDDIKNQTITLGNIASFSHHSNELILENILQIQSQNKNSKNKIGMEDIEAMKMKLTQFTNQLQMINTTVSTFAGECADYNEYLADIENQRLKFPSIKLNQLDSIWKTDKYENHLNEINELYQYRSSICFMNIFKQIQEKSLKSLNSSKSTDKKENEEKEKEKEEEKKDGEDQEKKEETDKEKEESSKTTKTSSTAGNKFTFEFLLHQLFPIAVKKFVNSSKRFLFNQSNVTVRRAAKLWTNVSLYNYESELQFIVKQINNTSNAQIFTPENYENIKSIVNKFVKKNATTELVEEMLRIFEIFKVQTSPSTDEQNKEPVKEKGKDKKHKEESGKSTQGGGNSENEIYFNCKEYLTIIKDSSKPVEVLINWITKISNQFQSFNEYHLEVIKYLSYSKEICEFLSSALEEDFRTLIDAVEENGDQFIRESTVSDFIEVKRFLYQLLVLSGSNQFSSVSQFIDSLNENLKKYEKSIENGLHLKIQSTNENIHGLIRLYQNVANRGEVTRDIILAATTHGSFIFNKKSDIAKPTVIMKISGGTSNNHTVNYNISEINDFRSRALLIVNTERMSNLDTANNTTSGHSTTSQGKDDDEEQNEQEKMISKWETEQQTMRGFISTVDLVQQILTCIEKLSVLGHFNYRLFQGEFSSHPSLVELFNKLQSDLIEWEKILNRARKLYYYLNYFHSYQLWILEDFFNKLENEYNQLLSDEESYKKIVLPAIDLLRYVNQSLPIDIKKLKMRKSRSASVVVPPSPSSLIAGQSKSENDLFQSLKQIGRQLNKIFSKKAIHKIEIPGDFELTTDDQGFTLIEGEVNLIPIPDEGHLINAIMSVYHFSGYYPDPSNLLICEKSTTWEDIYLLLLRCFYSMKFPEGEKLYCIANVDQLDYELQNKLSNTIKKLTVRNKCKWFVIIGCKKGLSQFPTGTVVQSGTGLTNATVSKLLTLLRPEIVCVTSEFPGLGKTETIKSMAFESRKNINTFSISGPLDINKLILRFKSLEFNHKLQSLHINISEVDNGRLLNRFLFQLTILGMIKSLTLIYHLCTFNIYIEIANTLQQHLLYNLYCCSYFKQKRLSWSIDRLIISKEILAPIQISCIYLDAFDNDKLDLFDLLFEGKIKNVKPLDDKQCIKLLDKYFFVKGDAYCSFSVLNTFIKVFSDQLLRLSKSSFFRIQTLKGMVDSKSVRKMLVQSLLEVALDFATRSVGVSKSLKTTIPSQVSLASLQQKHTRDEENGEATKEPQGTTPGGQMMFSNPEWDEMMVQRLQGMIEWQQTNHLLVMFQTQDSHSICALYRDKKLVPKEVKELLSSQSQKREQWELEDYQTMEHEELLLKLEKIARTTREEKQYPPYSITSDNLLKMALIIQRVRVGVPVVIMGETGCGKTSLIKFLAKAVDVSFRTLNFHAGITEDDILLFMSEIHKLARHGSVWVFFDEINTCDHLGLINEMICNRTLLGRPLNRKIVILAACNPYRFKTVRVQYDSGASAGLQDKLLNNPNKTDLVYRVHPLPESMLDYIWDYGSLDNQEERSYIEMMVKSSHNNQLIADLLVASQSFMRDKISAWSVSLRDVKRCRKLLRWFKEHLSVRSKVGKVSSWYERSKFIPQKLRSVKRPIRIMILALAHCYHSRLGKSEDRLEYREMISKVFKAHKIQLSADNFATVLAEEQLDYLQRMELPPAIALNEALRENVFVILVCILNQIPVFVVGSPGCSKSLSMRLINSNLRGPDSKDPFFQKLPQVYIVSYQGSESSTSEGIIKVFDKARKYKEHNPSVIPVVLLDEVGLAEVSKYNPLKVLHSLLEPDYPAEYPDVAVVGLSNWGLDAAKMNRAIVLSRPPPDTKDLVDTAYEIQSQLSKTGDILNKNLLSQIAKAYCYYQSNQKYSNFHGLRDFYSFIRNLCSIDKFDEKSLLYSLRRNFGGIKLELSVIEKQFTNQLNFIASSASSNSSNSNTSTGGGNDTSMVLELIHDNLVDQQARHLMLITKGDSAISILESQLQEKKRVMIIYGSQFEDDLSEEYSYVVLSQIILSMEKGSCLILKDLELVYGSLYDMLNQNYTIVGNKRNCRIALGAFSNPMCHVHPDFRCIVLVDKDKVDYSDPPFLNRFEKQELTYDDILSNTQKEAYQSLSKWIKSITTVTNHHEFEIEDAITTYSEDSLRSLILYHSSDDCSFEQLLWKCKNQLMIEMRLDQVVRAQHSPFAISNAAGGNESPFKKLMQQYWENSFDDLPKYIEYALNQRKSGDLQWVEGAGACFIVHTLDNIHQSLMDCLSYLPSDLNVQIDPINSITSQRQLLNVIRKYWEDPNQNLHLIECDSRTDSKHLTLVRYLINQSRREYLKKNQGKVIKDKHVGIIIQSYSSSSNIPSIKSTNTSNNLASSSVNHSNLHADYLTGWNYIYIDNLLPLSISRNVLFSHSILYILEHANFAGLLSQQFLKAFRFISYPKKNTKKYIKGLIDNTLKCEELIECFKHRIFEWIRINKNNDTLWQYNVLCKKSSIRSNCTNTLIDHVHSLIRAPLAMLIYELEKYYLLGRYFEIDDEDYKTQWRILFKDATILPIDHLLIPNKPKALQIQPPYDPNQFKFYTTLQQPNYGAKVVISTNLDELPVLEKPSLPKENEKNIIEENDDELESLEKLTDFI